MIAGEAAAGRLVGPVEGLAVAPKFIDVTLPAGAAFRELVPRGHTAFAYVDHGEVRFGPEQTPVNAPALVVLGDGRSCEASAEKEAEVSARVRPPLGGADRPLRSLRDEHRSEIEETLRDLRSGHFIRAEPRDE